LRNLLDVSVPKISACLCFFAALFIKGKIWNQLGTFRDELMKKILYIYTKEYYSAIKRNEILSFATKKMELEDIKLSEIS
jgi:hypothetical protein